MCTLDRIRTVTVRGKTWFSVYDVISNVGFICARTTFLRLSMTGIRPRMYKFPNQTLTPVAEIDGILCLLEQLRQKHPNVHYPNHPACLFEVPYEPEIVPEEHIAMVEKMLQLEIDAFLH